MADTLDTLRAKLQHIDAELLQLLADREQVSRAVGDWKRAHDMSVYDQTQEVAVRQRIRAQATELQLDTTIVEAIYQLIVERSRAVQDSGAVTGNKH